MLTDNLEGGYHSLLVAPNGLKSQLCAMIQQEIDKGPQGYLCIKANSITERRSSTSSGRPPRRGCRLR